MDFPFNSLTSLNLGYGLPDHMPSLRTQSGTIKLLQLLYHSLGVDRWWEQDLLHPQGCRRLGIPLCVPSPSLPPSITEHGARLLAFCVHGSQKALRVFP